MSLQINSNSEHLSLGNVYGRILYRIEENNVTRSKLVTAAITKYRMRDFNNRGKWDVLIYVPRIDCRMRECVIHEGTNPSLCHSAATAASEDRSLVVVIPRARRYLQITQIATRQRHNGAYGGTGDSTTAQSSSLDRRCPARRDYTRLAQ